MKRRATHIITLAVLLLSFSTHTYAESADEQFQKANELYKIGNYEQSIDTYNQILNSGYQSAPLYYNLGNAEFRNGNLGRAILNYERALRLSPSDKDIQANLAFAQSKTEDNINEIPSFFLAEWVQSITHLFSANGWAILCIVLMCVVCAVWALFFLARSYNAKKASFFSGLALTVILILSFINLCVSHNKATSHDEAIIMLPAVSVKTSPESDAADKFLLHEGTKVEVEDILNEWAKIRLADGNTGWTENSNLETI